MTMSQRDLEGPDKVTSSQERRAVLRQAENMLDLDPTPTKYTQTIRNLIMELALLDGMYELMAQNNRDLREELQRVKDIVGEDLPHWYLTHRLYALVYPQELIEEMLK